MHIQSISNSMIYRSVIVLCTNSLTMYFENVFKTAQQRQEVGHINEALFLV